MQYLYFMRHGETAYNRSGRVQGRTDIPLSDQGLIQAQLARDFFHKQGIRFDLVISSPLTRAISTASEIGQIPAGQVEQDERAIELNFGTAEGEKVNELPQSVLNLFFEPEKYVVPQGGESIEDLQERCRSFLADMADRLRSHPQTGNVLIVSHGAALRGFISCVEHTARKDFWAGNLENCCVYKVGFDGQTFHTEEYMHPLEGTIYMIPPWKRDEEPEKKKQSEEAGTSPAAGEGGSR